MVSLCVCSHIFLIAIIYSCMPLLWNKLCWKIAKIKQYTLNEILQWGLLVQTIYFHLQVKIWVDKEKLTKIDLSTLYHSGQGKCCILFGVEPATCLGWLLTKIRPDQGRQPRFISIVYIQVYIQVYLLHVTLDLYVDLSN